jgi:hypothetical protein
MTKKPYLVAFKATSMETRISIVDWLRDRDAVHVLADVWLVSLPQMTSGDIAHSIVQYDKFGAELIVLGLVPGNTDWAAEGFSEEARAWARTNLSP